MVRVPALGLKRLPWVVAALGLAAVGWLLATREAPAPAEVARHAPTSSSRPGGHTPAVVETDAPMDAPPGESAAGRNLPKIAKMMTADRAMPSPRRGDDTPHEPRFWEPGQDVDAPDAPVPGVAIDGPEAEAVFEEEEWHDAEWFGDERPLPGE